MVRACNLLPRWPRPGPGCHTSIKSRPLLPRLARLRPISAREREEEVERERETMAQATRTTDRTAQQQRGARVIIQAHFPFLPFYCTTRYRGSPTTVHLQRSSCCYCHFSFPSVCFFQKHVWVLSTTVRTVVTLEYVRCA